MQPERVVEINGEPRAIVKAATVAQLMAELGIEPGQVAVELNGRIVRRAEWAHTPIGDRDRVEIVRFVGGG